MVIYYWIKLSVNNLPHFTTGYRIILYTGAEFGLSGHIYVLPYTVHRRSIHGRDTMRLSVHNRVHDDTIQRK